MNGSRAIGMPVIVIAAILINAIMFGVIQYLVVNRQMSLTDATDFDISNFIRVHEQSREVRSRRDPKAPEKPSQEAQQQLNRLSSAPTSGGIDAFVVDIPRVDIDIDTGGAIQIARELTPLVRVLPEYPERARAQRLEGYVTMRFTVTETGSVADPEVIASEPPGYFDRYALRAILRWKYQPQLADGKPVSVVSYARIKFALAEQQQ